MGRFDFTFPDDLQSQLKNIAADFDEIAPKMINEAAPLLVKSIQKRLANHKRTGELLQSVSAYKARPVRGGGYYGRVAFDGYGTHQYKNKTLKVANAVKAAGLEYGSKIQTPKPFLQAAVNDSESGVLDKMQEVFTREVESR